MVIPYREFIEILCVGLLKYYKAYTHKVDDDLQKDSYVVNQLANEMIQELDEQFPLSKNTLHSISLFEMPFEVYVEYDEIDDLYGISFGTEYIELLVKFIQVMDHVPNPFIILSVNPISFDGLTIRHGMIIQYFDMYYK